jgi:hypothetical protein
MTKSYFTTKQAKTAGFAENAQRYPRSGRELVYVPTILAASATVIILVIGSAGEGMKPYFS